MTTIAVGTLCAILGAAFGLLVRRAENYSLRLSRDNWQEIMCEKSRQCEQAQKENYGRAKEIIDLKETCEAQALRIVKLNRLYAGAVGPRKKKITKK